eukprot:5220001-Amphidinium_carterae.1
MQTIQNMNPRYAACFCQTPCATREDMRMKQQTIQWRIAMSADDYDRSHAVLMLAGALVSQRWALLAHSLLAVAALSSPLACNIRCSP